MNDATPCCEGDSCDVTQLIREQREKKMKDRAAAMRVERWCEKLRLDPIDYDLPGSSARETGV